METMPLLKSKFLHQFEREQQYCLYHSLTQQKVYGGQILDALFSFKLMKKLRLK